MAENKRKGSRTIKNIPKNILAQLNHGEIETVSLAEWAAVDRRALLGNILAQYRREKYLTPILEKINNLKKQTVNTITETIGAGILEQATLHKDEGFLQAIATHESDLVRTWAAYAVGKMEAKNMKQLLQKIQPFAADRHFGVREEAWCSARPKIVQNVDESIMILSKWAINKDENIRRFASEATRPRGVWCEHIKKLKENPELGLSILEPLKSDKAKYVRDSVGNWLNDASKTQPEFVIKLCSRWEKESETKETKHIIKRALRTINKMV